MGKNKKRKNLRRATIGQQATQLVAVKTVMTDLQGKITTDYQLARIPRAITYDQFKQEMLTNYSINHPEIQFSIEIYDPDNMPLDGSIPEGVTFRTDALL